MEFVRPEDEEDSIVFILRKFYLEMFDLCLSLVSSNKLTLLSF